MGTVHDRSWRRCVGFVLVCLAVLAAWAGGARNVVLMIADGAGFNAFHCAAYYEHGRLGAQPYDTFPVRLGCTTYPVDAGYDPAEIWSDFKDLKDHATDSAAAATALYAGVKTKNGRIAVDPEGQPVTTIAEIAHALGKATGAVTTVPFCHATPATLAAHVESRSQYHDIAEQLIYQSNLTVLFGAGHPEYDNDGRRRRKDDPDKYLPWSIYRAIRMNTTGRGWTFIDRLDQFRVLAAGRRIPGGRVFGLARCRDTLQCDRDGHDMGHFNDNVPDLATMARAALSVLERDDDGFFLMIEGGAIDWANHGNNLGRMVEEFADFDRAVAAVLDWLDTHGQLDQTLLIVTADHECGQIWGPDAGSKSKTPFDLPKSRGKGKLPAARYFSGGHTNVLVPLYATGPGSDHFEALVDGRDDRAGRLWHFDGRYVDNTDVFVVMKEAITARN